MNSVYREVCEGLEWGVVVSDDGTVELEKYSPAGEDFSFTAREDHFVEDVREYADTFDPEKHVEMWVEARIAARREGRTDHGIPLTARLVEDADAIDTMLEELATALQNAEPAESGEGSTKVRWAENFCFLVQ